MNAFQIVILSTTGAAKDVHPMGDKPVLPKREAYKEGSEGDKKFEDAFLKADTELTKWYEVDATLKTYQIETMKCDSEIIVSNKVLHWHEGRKYKAILINESLIQIV